MHVCLNVDEILRLLAYGLVASGAKATAVAFACCCKKFEDPVLDAVWKKQESLVLLLDTFPEDVWDESQAFVSFPATNYMISTERLDRKGVQKNADDLRVGSVRKVHPTNAGTQTRPS
jgi:hypothetical protein